MDAKEILRRMERTTLTDEQRGALEDAIEARIREILANCVEDAVSIAASPVVQSLQPHARAARALKVFEDTVRPIPSLREAGMTLGSAGNIDGAAQYLEDINTLALGGVISGAIYLAAVDVYKDTVQLQRHLDKEKGES